MPRNPDQKTRYPPSPMSSSAKGAPGRTVLGWIQLMRSVVAAVMLLAARLLAAVVIAVVFSVHVGGSPRTTDSIGAVGS
jgi:hypothetical protein